MSSLFPVYPQIACALVFFLASFAFPPHFLRPDSQGVTAVAGGVTAENLQVASATNPTGIDRQTPSLSWELRATLPEAHDLGQSSYRILVASSAEEVAEDRGSLWDSGRVQSSQRLYVTYCGRPLTSHQSYYWKVRVWDQVGKASGWSAPAKWTTAIRHPDEWS
jgi:alpha-L-rhamnosidase